MEPLGFFMKLIFVIIIVAGLFFVEKFIEKNYSGQDSIIWRWVVGAAFFIFAVGAFIWIKSRAHSSDIAAYVFKKAGTSKLLNESTYTLLMIGVAILAIVGIGEIVIGILNFVVIRKRKK